MARKISQGVSRREFVKIAGAGTLAAGMGPAFLYQKGPQKTLKIIQWSHFVPAYDKEWFDTVVTSNMFGDIFTDLSAMIQGRIYQAMG